LTPKPILKENVATQSDTVLSVSDVVKKVLHAKKEKVEALVTVKSPTQEKKVVEPAKNISLPQSPPTKKEPVANVTVKPLQKNKTEETSTVSKLVKNETKPPEDKQLTVAEQIDKVYDELHKDDV
jgi:hypothetical protein